jgi:hypothetical protein
MVGKRSKTTCLVDIVAGKFGTFLWQMVYETVQDIGSLVIARRRGVLVCIFFLAAAISLVSMMIGDLQM